MIRSIKYSLLAVFGLLLVACNRNVAGEGGKLPKKKDAELVERLNELSSLEYDYFYTKISTKYTDTAQSVSFKTSVRVVADSATNLLITYARIPFVNALITTDSVTVTNKRDKCYTAESISFIKEKFGVDFTLKNIEELMIGLPVGFDPEVDYYQMESTKSGYIICSHSKRDLKKMEKGELDEVVIFYTLSPDLKQLISTSILSPKDNTEIKIDYKTRELIGTVLMPSEVSIVIITPAQEMSIEMEYRKTRINEVESIHFVIPDSYGKCE